MSRVLLVRHAESTWNALRLWQGQGDPPLSERGREQAASLGARFVEAGIERIVSSDLRRAAETAGIVGARINVAVTLDPRLREHDVGAWSGLSHEEIARRWPDEFARFRAGDPDVALGGGESNRLLRSRVRAALAALRADAAGHVLAVVTHAGVIRALAGPVTVENAATVWWDGVPVDE